MDRANRLIKWQRITIATLLTGLVFACIFCFTQTFAVKEAAEEAQRLSADNQTITAMFNNDERILRDMDVRLSRYEKRYGEITPVRKGEGVNLNGPSSVLDWHRLPSR